MHTFLANVLSKATAGSMLVALLVLALPAQVSAAGCQFVLGFQTLHDLAPDDVGDCIEDQSFVTNGDAQQRTTKGVMVWRKADNWTAFTNGYQTWLNGPDGLAPRLNTERFEWEADYNTFLLPQLSDLPAGFKIVDGQPTFSKLKPSSVIPVVQARDFILTTVDPKAPIALYATIGMQAASADAAHLGLLSITSVLLTPETFPNISVSSQPSPGIGDESVLLPMTFSSNGAKLNAAFVSARRGPVLYAQLGIGTDPVQTTEDIARKSMR